MLLEQYGLTVSPDYIRAIRRETIRRGDRVFVLGMARASELMEWARVNPDFRRRTKTRPAIG